jgi:hypothetical protein
MVEFYLPYKGFAQKEELWGKKTSIIIKVWPEARN